MAATRRRGRPAATDAAETRARILEAARLRFVASGFARCRIQEIAAGAGVTANAVYHYFDSKASLFIEVYESGVALLLDAYHLSVEGNESLTSQLIAIVGANAEINRSHPGLAEFLALAAVEIRRDPDLSDAQPTNGTDVATFFQSVFEAGAQRGELAPGVSPADAANLLIAVTYGLSWAHGELKEQADHEAILSAFQGLLRGDFLRTN